MTSPKNTTATDPNFRPIGGRWIFNGCINASGFPTLEAAQQAHPITWQLRHLPCEANGKLSTSNRKIAKQLNAELTALSHAE
jgi:cytochrome c-type biogenesis protein CcmH/NrfF